MADGDDVRDDAPKATSPAASAPELNTYEECQEAIKGALASKDIAMKDEVMNRVAQFFNRRIAKKQSESERDGSGYVKKAIIAGRKFRPFEPKKKEKDESSPISGQSLFGK